MKSNKRLSTTLTYVVLILGSILMIFPFVWMLLTSFKTQAESMAIPPQILPSQWCSPAWSPPSAPSSCGRRT